MEVMMADTVVDMMMGDGIDFNIHFYSPRG